MNKKAVVYGLMGKELMKTEADFFREINPLGFIFFSRNIESREQLKKLVNDLKKCLNRDDVLFLIDQEGGRVRRLRPPLSKSFPAARNIGNLVNINYNDGSRFNYLNALMIGWDLIDLGINVNCAPCLDLYFEDASEVIGDRAFSKNPEVVKWAAKDYALGLIHAGVTPIIKHIPGHGRSMKDTHKEVAKVSATLEDLRKTDFIPFLNFPYPVFSMMSHIVYESIDEKLPATLSRKVRKVINDELNFKGIVFSDDFSMGALTGFDNDFTKLAHDALDGAVDVVLHCNGNIDEMQKIAKVLKDIDEEKETIITETVAVKKDNLDMQELEKEYEVLYGKYFA